MNLHYDRLLSGLLCLITVAILTGCGARPAAVEGYAELPYTVSRGDLSLTISAEPDGEQWQIAVADSRTERVWTADGRADRHGRVLAVRKANAFTLQMVLTDPRGDDRYHIDLELEHTPALAVRIEAENPERDFEGLRFPPAFRTDFEDGRLLLCDRAAGAFVPMDSERYAGRVLRVYGNTSALDMPWIGTLEAANLNGGDGLMMLFRTPFDAAVRMQKDSAGKGWPEAWWLPTLGTFGHERRIELRFQESGGPVAMARDYRAIAEREGKVYPLYKRLAERPLVDWLRGAPVVWGLEGIEDAREMRARGIRRAVINGQYPPADMAEMKEMGFLTGEYDSFTDIQEGEPGHQTDRVREVAYRLNDGSIRRGWRTAWGTQYYVRSHAFARDRAELYVPKVLARYPYTSRFIDVSAAIEPFEDYFPGRTFGSRQDIEYRLDLFRYFTENLGLVLGGEHTKGWSMPLFDYTEGTMSGSFWWQNSKAGHLLRVDDYEEIPEDYLKYGIDPSVRLPLWDLVFHDTVVNTWYWGDSNGYLHNVAPEISDVKDALNVLHGTPPLYWMNHLGYGWDRDRERLMDSWRVTAPWHARVAFEDLVNFEWLTEDQLVQRTTFWSGAHATVNFREEPWPLTGDENLTLAPNGFLAKSDDGAFRMARFLATDGHTVTSVSEPGFASLRTPVAFQENAFDGSGTIDAFRVEEGRWHLAARGQWRVTLDKLPSWPVAEQTRVVRLSEDGRAVREETELLREGVLQVDTGDDNVVLYGLLPGAGPERVLIMPEGGTLQKGQAVRLAAGPGMTIRYTTDGSPVTAGSPVYEEPLLFSTGTELHARAFAEGEPAGEEAAAFFSPRRNLVEDLVMRGKEPARELKLDLTNVETLRFVITDAGDGLDFDTVGIAGGILRRGNGETVRLVDLEPAFADQSVHEEPEFRTEDAYEIAGRHFEHGIYAHAFARFDFDLGSEYAEGIFHLGLPDREEGNGTAAFTIQAEY